MARLQQKLLVYAAYATSVCGLRLLVDTSCSHVDQWRRGCERRSMVRLRKDGARVFGAAHNIIPLPVIRPAVHELERRQMSRLEAARVSAFVLL